MELLLFDEMLEALLLLGEELAATLLFDTELTTILLIADDMLIRLLFDEGLLLALFVINELLLLIIEEFECSLLPIGGELMLKLLLLGAGLSAALVEEPILLSDEPRTLLLFDGALLLLDRAVLLELLEFFKLPEPEAPPQALTISVMSVNVIKGERFFIVEPLT